MTNSQASTYQLWWNEVISSGLTGNALLYLPYHSTCSSDTLHTGDLIWQAGSVLSNGPTANDGFAVYPTGTVYPVMETAAAALKARG